MRKLILLCVLFAGAVSAFAAEVTATVTIAKVDPKGGAVYLAVYDSAEALKKKKNFRELMLPVSGSEVTGTLSLPEGDYYIAVYQDANSNGKMDTNLIGMPKEPVGISNYNGKGIPGGFDKQKVRIDAVNAAVSIDLQRL